MGFFDFLKPKQNNQMNDTFARMEATWFPKGEKDIKYAVNELLFILNNKIDSSEAETIILKSIAISNISQEFNKDRLKLHLAGYCLNHFNDSQLEAFYNYLQACKVGRLMSQKTPSEITRIGDNGYAW
jgi:hypothetical protein